MNFIAYLIWTTNDKSTRAIEWILAFDWYLEQGERAGQVLVLVFVAIIYENDWSKENWNMRRILCAYLQPYNMYLRKYDPWPLMPSQNSKSFPSGQFDLIFDENYTFISDYISILYARADTKVMTYTSVLHPKTHKIPYICSKSILHPHISDYYISFISVIYLLVNWEKNIFSFFF